MRTWLRGWFAWRFSLRRLVIATVVLGGIIGLNLSRIGPIFQANYKPSGDIINFWGWPLPYIAEPERPKSGEPVFVPNRALTTEDKARLEKYETEFSEIWMVGHAYRLPWTHQLYRILGMQSFRWLMFGNGPVACGVVNVFAMTGSIFLILFLQIPRLRAPTGTAPGSPADPSPRPPQTPPVRS
jgi:hypothetical protein